MQNFWNNINKYPKFFISIIIGFFLTTFRPVFESLESKKKRYSVAIITLVLMTTISKILFLMLGTNKI